MRNAIPPHAHFRPGSVDADVWQESLVGNVYRLPEEFRPGDNVLDVGAHTGSVAWRCANAGASVVAVEPGRDNYKILLHNTDPLKERIVCVHAAAWRSDRMPTLLPFQHCWIPMNNGGGCTMGDAGTPTAHECLGIPLDDLLRLRPSWRLLKIDCEGAEFTILHTSRELGRVGEVVGEYHERDAVLPFADAGACRMGTLAGVLQARGFVVEVVPKNPEKTVGLFFARRG